MKEEVISSFLKEVFMKVKKFIQWLPGIISELIAALFCIIYAVIDGSKATMYFQLLTAFLLPFIFPIYGVISKKPLPLILSIISAVFVIFASGLGSAMGLYDKIYCWDLIMHGIFGFACSLIIFVLLIRCNGNKLNPIGFMIIIFLVTMGVAAIWEIIEYLADRLMDGDSQRVLESVALGKSPVADTMEDIMIAMAGCAVFFVTLFIDKFCNYKLYSRLCDFTGFEKSKDNISSIE
ncbi:MAG: hypothetical protein K2H02_00545 [Anaeroplasmataceae bacterium]|nr:hypothetical protein [Anaeroplasmataceae bacterium]